MHSQMGAGHELATRAWHVVHGVHPLPRSLRVLARPVVALFPPRRTFVHLLSIRLLGGVMDTTTEALDALSEVLELELRDPWLWIPTGVVALVSELVALRTGRSPATDLARFAWAKPALRYSIMAWGLVTGCHVARWPAALTKFDPYSAAGGWLIRYGRAAAQEARRDLERARSA